MPYYAVTLKQNFKTKPQEYDYEMWFEYAFYHQGMMHGMVYELDSKDRLHCHAILSFPRKIFKQSLSVVGMHQKLDELKTYEDKANYARYMSKSQGNRDQYEQMLQSYYYRNFYGFCDDVSGE